MIRYRTGLGYDVHRFCDNGPLMLGGVRIDFERGLEGHSDADVVLHAITDALLGAAALGDIGRHFPPSDPRHANRPSVEFLVHAGDLLIEAGFSIVNIDCTIVAEEPRIGPHASAMQLTIARSLGLSSRDIGIKATTNESMGFVGRKEGIAALAIATIVDTSEES
jgi:2-C-methyl-D-erythritol 4-phosphate cytidylyltransferase / 2-C-methyl-D-erythritol 2,4-cyclodiphosphate synthase